MAEPSSDSQAIEHSLLELYEPDEHATPMMVINFLQDLARRSATMPSALSEDLLNRQRVTANLRVHLEAALIRVACTHANVRIKDNGHGAWEVLGLQPRADTAPRAPACPDGDARHLPSRSKSSSHPGPKRARLANPEAEILRPGTRFQWKGRTYEIDRHDRMQSTPAKQYYHLRRDGKPLGSSYARDRHWIVAEPPTSRLEESLLGFVSTVVDWGTIGAWGDETVCRGWGGRYACPTHPKNRRAPSAHAPAPSSISFPPASRLLISSKPSKRSNVTVNNVNRVSCASLPLSSGVSLYCLAMLRSRSYIAWSSTASSMSNASE